jgi:enamine deaminase RidA (YjgF/YER057c/UK114 family)
MIRRQVDAGVPWADVMGYSRAIRVGDVVEVAGTSASDESGVIVGADDAGAQARFILQKVRAALEELGARLDDVVRTRVYLRHPERDWESVARAHGDAFARTRPVNTTVGAIMVDPAMLVEIEVTAIVHDDG